MIIALILTRSAAMTYPASIFLGILAFLFDELKKREARGYRSSRGGVYHHFASRRGLECYRSVPDVAQGEHLCSPIS